MINQFPIFQLVPLIGGFSVPSVKEETVSFFILDDMILWFLLDDEEDSSSVSLHETIHKLASIIEILVNFILI